MAATLSGSLGRGSGAQRGVRGAIFGLIRVGGGHGEFDAAHAGAHQGPIFSSLRRIVPHEARANWVWARPMRRKAQIST